MEPILPEPNHVSGESADMSYEAKPGSEGVAERSVELGATIQGISPGQPQAQIPQQPVAPQQVQQVAAPGPVIADDVDVIEKEWVDKAKKIVNATKSDPHEQGKEVSKLQADYLMKRYNKTLKVTE